MYNTFYTYIFIKIKLQYVLKDFFIFLNIF